MSSLTTKLLIEIRDEIRSTNTRLDQTNARLDDTNAQLHTHAKVLVRLVDLSERHEQVLGKLVTSVESLNGRFDNFLTGAHQKAHEETRRKYEELDVRVTRLESGKPGRRRAS